MHHQESHLHPHLLQIRRGASLPRLLSRCGDPFYVASSLTLVALPVRLLLGRVLPLRVLGVLVRGQAVLVSPTPPPAPTTFSKSPTACLPSA